MTGRVPAGVVVACVSVMACRSSTSPGVPVPKPVAAVNVIPAPALLALAGQPPFQLDGATRIVVATGPGSESAFRVGEALAARLRPATGLPLPVTRESSSPRGAFVLRADAGRQDLGDEGYELTVTTESVHLEAQTAAGLFHGVQTIRQLLPFRIEAETSVTSAGAWGIPTLTIRDQPRFAWRGAMLDVARHFFTVDEVKQFIDILALYKLNIFHIHLTDDQGWRIEIKSRPTLVASGSAMQVGGGPGGFYTQADYAEIVRYATEQFITVVPEVDMPAHTNAMLISYPELSCGQPPVAYTSIRVGFSAMCPDKEETFQLVDDIVREIAALTPGPYFHMGGDEVEMLTHDQYSRFVERVQDIITRHGKGMVGWEEITKARLHPASLAQLWKSTRALQSGAKLIMSPATKVYLDMKYTTATELGLDWAGRHEIDVSYEWDPATLIPGVGESQIVGIEAPLWAETTRNITAAQHLMMPRLPSIAEVAWSPQPRRRWEDFRHRVAAHAPRWRLMGINYYASPQIPW